MLVNLTGEEWNDLCAHLSAQHKLIEKAADLIRGLDPDRPDVADWLRAYATHRALPMTRRIEGKDA